MNKVQNLMEIGKLTLQLEEWSWGSSAALCSEHSSSGVSGQSVLQFTHLESQPPPYSDETVDTEITVEEAKELIAHLQKFIDREVKDEL